MTRKLTGLKIQNKSTFEIYIVKSFNEASNNIQLYNTETQKVVDFVLSRVLKGLQTGAFTELTR